MQGGREGELAAEWVWVWEASLGAGRGRLVEGRQESFGGGLGVDLGEADDAAELAGVDRERVDLVGGVGETIFVLFAAGGEVELAIALGVEQGREHEDVKLAGGEAIEAGVVGEETHLDLVAVDDVGVERGELLADEEGGDVKEAGLSEKGLVEGCLERVVLEGGGGG